MRYVKKNGLYIPKKKPEHYMGCMGIEDQFPFKQYHPYNPKGILTPNMGGGVPVAASYITPDTWNERFEDAVDGYNETWDQPAETTNGTVTVKSDSTATPPGNPSGWGTYCTKYAITLAGGNADSYHSSFNLAKSYGRIEFVLSAENLANDQGIEIAQTFSPGWASNIWRFFVQQNSSGVLQLLAACYYDGSYHLLAAAPTITLGQRHRLEWLWDNTGNAYEWKFDGASQNSGSGTADVNTETLVVGIVPGGDATATVYMDNIGVDITEWIGAPSP